MLIVVNQFYLVPPGAGSQSRIYEIDCRRQSEASNLGRGFQPDLGRGFHPDLGRGFQLGAHLSSADLPPSTILAWPVREFAIRLLSFLADNAGSGGRRR